MEAGQGGGSPREPSPLWARRWRRLRALLLGLRYVATHPKEDLHALAHPLETYRRATSKRLLHAVATAHGERTQIVAYMRARAACAAVIESHHAKLRRQITQG